MNIKTFEHFTGPEFFVIVANFLMKWVNNVFNPQQ